MQDKQSGSNGDKRAPMGWDMRTIAFLAVTIVWTISVLADIVVLDFDVPVYVHGAMIAVVGYFVGDRVKKIGG